MSVAGSRGPDGGDHGYVWSPEGTGRLLPMPDVAGRPAVSFWPISIYDGVVFGRATDPRPDGSLYFHPFLFDLRTDRYTALTHDFGLVGNGLGWMAGYDKRGMFVAAPAGRATLPTIGPFDDGDPNTFNDNDVVYISEDGLTLGGQSPDAGQIQAVRWRCVK